jgi:hypothetical protein
MKQFSLILFLFIGFSAFGQPGNDVITPENSRAKRKEQHDKIGDLRSQNLSPLERIKPSFNEINGICS